jgi:ATP-binding cassette, subfamily B, bacterial PglK
MSQLLLLSLWGHIDARRRIQFSFLLALMILVSFVEVISIGSVLPFLGALTSPDRIFNLESLRPFIDHFGLTEPNQLLFPLTLIFGFFSLLAGGARLLMLRISTWLSYEAGADLSLNIYRRTLYQPYAVHCRRNSSEVINAISSKTNAVIYIMMMLLNCISSTFILITILSALLVINPTAAIVTFGGFGTIYIVITKLTHRRLSRNSKTISKKSTQVIKSLQEGLGGIRDILIDGSQLTYCQTYSSADSLLRRAQSSSSFIAASPRYIIEALGMFLIALIAYVLSRSEGGIGMAIPILGALALGAQRLMPILQQGYSSWSSIKSAQDSLLDALELLNQPLPAYINSGDGEKILFKKEIVLQEISFKYGVDHPIILDRINLRIPKGSRVGIVGETGSGKSTLLDLVMGLLEPTSGIMTVDDQLINFESIRGWQRHIAHVPQVIYLADASVAENIAFGIPLNEIDHERVAKAAWDAKISETIEGWRDKYNTMVGENGVRLSGGQRQRIGIARALYKQADVIILDEATSALDSATEAAVMQTIDGLSKELTLIIVAHRLTTLNSCTHVIEITNGFAELIGDFSSLSVRASLKA